MRSLALFGFLWTLGVSHWGPARVVAESDVLAHRATGTNPPSLSITQARITAKWIEGSNKTQIITFLVTNTDSSNALIASHALNITATSSSFTLVQPGYVKRLLPGQSAWATVGVAIKSAGSCSATITGTWSSSAGSTKTTTASVSGTCGFPNYSNSAASVNRHETPDWYNGAKFGIFIHWGLYAAPAWGGPHNNGYAEWYWNAMHSQSSGTNTYQYHKQTYGENFNYDDFMSNFTAANWNATQWLSLFQDAGARYFVPVTKHHDGFAIFNTPSASSLRNSVNYGPKRDFLKELFDVAKADFPNLHRGTYFSMPEWYNPAYKKYAMGSFPGGPPTNPYTGATVTYTGYVAVNDFVTDIQAPQMRSLAYDYDSEIMWCDIGGANDSPQVLSDWINWANNQNRQVTFNNRCGSVKGDFNTPEYTTNSGLVTSKWESNRGMDPFSFGYNYVTPDNEYMTGEAIIKMLVDIVSKNGNFLLDVGPEHDGTIKQIMQTNLRAAGKWIHAHAESIFDTTYWDVTSGANPLRYTTTLDAFYIHVNSQPSTSLHIPDKVPYLTGDKVTIVGGSMAGTAVPATLNSDGSVTLSLTSQMIAADSSVWTFKITY